MTDQSERPPVHVIEAFGGEPGTLTKLAGGQGTSWRAGKVALKPAEPGDGIDWLAAVLAQVPDTDDFRVARPVPAANGQWTVHGWSATTWLDGVHVRGRWEDGLRVSAAFHTALAQVHADPPRTGVDPWSIGMRVAWGKESASDYQPDVGSLLENLSLLLEQPWDGPPAQIIHGDLGGNIVYTDGLPPAIIDMSPHFAPAPFADAIIIADAIAWDGAPAEIASRFADEQPAGAQLLARAVVFRVVTVAELVDSAEHVTTEAAAYRPVVDVAVGKVPPHRGIVM